MPVSLTITIKDAQGKVLGEETKRFGLPYDKILRGPIPDPFIKGGNTRKVPFTLPLAAGVLAPVGILLSPAVGAIFMSLSTIIVAINAQLLRRAEM